MEIKIKDKDKLIDATIEVIDGVMVVSPKEVKFEPKDGDVVFSGSSLISIFKEFSSYTSLASYVSLSNEGLVKGFDFWSASNIRPATEEEKNKLFDKLKEEGYKWDANKKELVKLKWKPVLCEVYYRPQFYQGYFEICKDVWKDSICDEIFYNKYWCFKTEKECQELVDKLNQAIEGVKP